MDAAEELDDQRTGGGGLGGSDAEDGEGQQQPHTGPGVGLQQEQHRLSGLTGSLVDTQRGEHTVVDRVVEEEDLGRFDQQ